MWQKIAEEMKVPWIKAEQNHWRLGTEEMEKRAGDLDFPLVSHKEEMWTKVAVQVSTDTSWTVAEHNHWCIGQSEMARRVGKTFLSEDSVDLPKLEAKLAENDEAQVQSQQQDQPQSTHNSPWSGDEEAILLAKYAGDIYKCVTDNLMPTCGKVSWENRRKYSNKSATRSALTSANSLV
ncbi:hypothetical protein E4U52_007494 [Claviceps spartinae]|nr:hypothetical protein E4U52_007494 [Claviceps spartinae]